MSEQHKTKHIYIIQQGDEVPFAQIRDKAITIKIIYLTNIM